ncbi:MAG: hypothetical protein WCI73_04710 [Phycisphaerae bacterium]
MSTASQISFPETLRLVICATCGMCYAIPESLILVAQRDQMPIFCPRGHDWVPLAHDADRCSNAVAWRLELLATLANTRVKLEAARRRVLELTPADGAPTTKAELRRRSQIVAHRADAPKGNFGRAVCQFCGKVKARSALAEHLRRQHGDALAEKPAAYFDAAADKLLAANLGEETGLSGGLATVAS